MELRKLRYSLPLRWRGNDIVDESLARHHGDELLVVDLAIAVDVGLTNHLVHFLVRKLLAQVGHHVAQLGRADVTVPVFVKYPARFWENEWMKLNQYG